MASAQENVPPPEVTQTRRIDAAAAPLRADPSADKIFELLIACYAMRIGTEVHLDPIKATAADQGRNPDVLATIGGRRWGFACKALHSAHPEAMYAHVEKAVQQIEDSEAELGAVVFSLRTQLDPAVIWPMVEPALLGDTSEAALAEPGVWDSDATLLKLLVAAKDDRESALMQHLVSAQEAEIAAATVTRVKPRRAPAVAVDPHALAVQAVKSDIERLFAGKKALPGWAFYLHGVARVHRSQGPGAGQPGITSLRAIRFTEAAKLTPWQRQDLNAGLGLLNDAVQRVYDPPA
jgi:hypothetical protein